MFDFPRHITQTVNITYSSYRLKYIFIAKKKYTAQYLFCPSKKPMRKKYLQRQQNHHQN